MTGFFYEIETPCIGDLKQLQSTVRAIRHIG